MMQSKLGRLRSRGAYLAIAAILVAGTALSAWLVYRHHRYQHYVVHEPERVYRSAWLAPDAIAELVHTHHLKTVINLCEPGETGEANWDAERKAVAAAGAQFLEIPMPGNSRPGQEFTDARPHLDVLLDPSNFPILVHCHQGITRTGKFLALYDVTVRGKSADDALSTVPLFGRDQIDPVVVKFAHQLESTRGTKSLDNAVPAPKAIASRPDSE